MKNFVKTSILFVFVFILSYFISDKMMDNLNAHPIQIQKIDWIVLLANGTDIKNQALRDRLDNSILALELWPQAKIFVVGDKKEIEVMRTYLIQKKIPTEALVYDDTANNTWVSFEHAQKYIKNADTTLVVTNEFHQKRALATATLLGFKAVLFGKDSIVYNDFWYHWGREKLSTIKWLGNTIIYWAYSHL